MATTQWTLDQTHSEIGFKIKHLMISNVSGYFNKFDVEVETSGNDFTSAAITVKIDVASINTNNEQRDAHLHTADFFEIENYPQITFTSNRIEKLDDELFNIFGYITIKETTKPITLLVEYSGIAKDAWGNVKAGFTIKGKMNRKDFGLSYNAALETGGLMLGEELKINGEIQLIKQAELQPA